MKILHAVHNYPPEFRGGVERVVEALAAAQAARGHEVAILAGSEESAGEPEVRIGTHQGMIVHRVVRGPGLRDPIDPFRAELAPLIERVLDTARPDVFHVHHWFNLGSDLVRRAARRGIPAVVTLHDFYATCGLFFRLPGGTEPCDLEQAEKNCVPCIGPLGGFDAEETRFRVEQRRASLHAELLCAAAVTAPSASHAAALRPHVPARASIEPVAPGSVALPRAAVTPSAGPLRVLHFGNLCRLKGVELAVRAVRAADPSGRDIRLTLAGPIVEPALDTGSARLAGAYDAAALEALAADADLAIFPSFARESYSLTVDEALHLGLPVAVADRGALGERVGARGVVVAAGDEGAWAAMLRRFASDRTALAALRNAPVPVLPTPAQHADRMLSIYANAVIPSDAPLDLEAPMLARLSHFERRLGDFARMLMTPPKERG